MAQGFYGADPEQLRALAKQFSSGSNQIRSSLDTVSSLVNSTQSWHGPDASAFQQRWNSQVKQLGNTVVHALEQGSTTLIKNADEQTATSQVDGGAGGHGGAGGNGGPGSPGSPGSGQPGAHADSPSAWDAFTNGWDKYSDITSGLDVAKGAYGLGWMYQHGMDPLVRANWERLPGRSAPFNLMDSASDLLKLDNLEKYFPKLNISEDVLNSSTGLARAKNGVLSFIGDGGLGKGLGVVDVGINAIDTAKNLADGDLGGAAWSGTKTALAVASFLPPPAGTVAQVASAAIWVYELPGVKDFVDSGAKAVADTVSNAIKDPGKFATDVGNNLKNAGEGVKNFLGL
jgi:uncharacterized protein YukE